MRTFEGIGDFCRLWFKMEEKGCGGKRTYREVLRNGCPVYYLRYSQTRRRLEAVPSLL